MEANEATQTHCYNLVAPAYPIWAYGRQRRCQEDPVSLPSGRLEKTTRLSRYHVAQHRPTGSETTPPYAPRSSRFGSEPPSVEDDVDVWHCAIVRVHARNGDDDECWGTSVMPIARAEAYMVLLKELGYTVTDQHKHHQSQKYISSCTQIKGRAKAAAKS